ncbi:hypothetical protein Y032_0018g3529 [Ancylostoma ceylanicum]|nr:hypothetical protein Y032_0018g3529 [Ancylostoma ceylanicum]
MDICCVCGHGPHRLNYLYDHLRKQHKWDEKQIEQKKIEHQKRNAEKENYRCSICVKILGSIRSLKRHMEEIHAISELDIERGLVTCPSCGRKFAKNSDLARHCREQHSGGGNGQDYETIKGEFTSMQEFESWKESLEASATTTFAKRSSKHSKHGRKHYYICKYARRASADIHAEEYIDAYGRTKRVHHHCPAFLKVLERDDGTVHYEACVGHLGHAVNPAFFRLSNSDENVIVNVPKLDKWWDRGAAFLGKDNQSEPAQERRAVVPILVYGRLEVTVVLIHRKSEEKPSSVLLDPSHIKTGKGPNKHNGQTHDELFVVDPVPACDARVKEEPVIEAEVVADEEINAPSTSHDPEVERIDLSKEAFQRFEEVVAYAYEVMRSCMEKNLHELINEATDALEFKINEIAEKAGFNFEVPRRAAVLSNGVTPKLEPMEKYETVRIK